MNNQQTMRRMLKTDRSFLMYFLLSLVTFGIYPIIAFTTISEDINTIASQYDGKKTMNYCIMFFLLSPLTCGIYGIYWFHTFSDRIGNELRRRNCNYEFGAVTWWLWCVLGSLIIVGPFVYIYKLFQAMNLLCASYNQYG